MSEIEWRAALNLPVHMLRSRLFSTQKMRTGDESCCRARRTHEHCEPSFLRFLQETASDRVRDALKGGRIPARAIVPPGGRDGSSQLLSQWRDTGIAQEIRFARMLQMWYARGRENREGWANLEAFQPPRQAFTHAA